jgi:predicted DCC family thiol-disulfide oxidoreductase YuxK
MEVHDKHPPTEKKILYDGYCNLCNASMQFVRRHDKKKQFQFVPISDWNKEGIEQPLPDSIVVIINNTIYIEFDAILQIIHYLGGWLWLFKLTYIVPRKIRNKVYRWVARNRYKWFGKSEQCSL